MIKKLFTKSKENKSLLNTYAFSIIMVSSISLLLAVIGSFILIILSNTPKDVRPFIFPLFLGSSISLSSILFVFLKKIQVHVRRVKNKNLLIIEKNNRESYTLKKGYVYFIMSWTATVLFFQFFSIVFYIIYLNKYNFYFSDRTFNSIIIFMVLGSINIIVSLIFLRANYEVLKIKCLFKKEK